MTHRTLLRGGHIVTMDAQLGDIDGGDVLVEDGLIREVGVGLAVDDAEIIDVSGHVVIPGLIDTHRHTWQAQLRALCADWTLTEYLFGIRLTIAPAYSAEDVYLGNLLGAVDAIDAGVTTLLDFSHCNNTPEHSDAAVAGLRDAGIRAVFGYGFFASSLQNPVFETHHDRIRDFGRIADTYFGSRDQLLTLGASLTETGIVPWSDTVAELTAARDHDALVVAHTGCAWGSRACHGILEMEAAGLLDDQHVHVHCNDLTEEEWAAIARAEAKVSISPETELNMGMGRLAFEPCERHGLKPTLSCDVISLNTGDLFTQMRVGLGFKRWTETEELNLAGGMPDTVSTSSREALEWCTSNAAQAVGMPGRIGSLTPGKEADVVVVGGPRIAQHPRPDPVGSLVFQTTPADVRTVMVAGRILKRDGELVGVDLPGLLARADASCDTVLQRVRATGATLPFHPEGGMSVMEPMIEANFAGAMS